MLSKQRSGTLRRKKSKCFNAVLILPAVGLLLYAIFGVLHLSEHAPGLLAAVSGGAGCVAWHQTIACSPYGARLPSGDRSCDAVLTRDAGYCECEGRWTTHRTTCGQHSPFTCREACRALTFGRDEAVRLPQALTCKGKEPYLASRYISSDRPEWSAAEAAIVAASASAARASGAIAPSAKRSLQAQQSANSSSRMFDVPQQQSDAAGHVSAQQQQQQQQQPDRAQHVMYQQTASQRSRQRRRLASAAALPPSEKDQQIAGLWNQVQQALLASGPHAVEPPGVRTNGEDFVRRGLRMAQKDVQRAQRQWQAYLAEAPAYPEARFQGRGVVILAGSLSYLVPAWVNVHMLRMAGCTLPVEMWFPQPEAPSAGVAAALARLGVAVRQLPPSAGRLAGFTMKAATLLLAGFEEVLFLDSDNIAVQDPASLFAASGYQRTGALLWPDYWAASAAPDTAAVLQLDATTMPAGSFESGQMLFDKRRNWRGLLLAAYLNMQSSLYYELLSNFMGKGDKETFAYALLAANSSYGLIRTPVGSVGISKMHCNKNQKHCWHEFAGNTMTQHDEQGRLMFLHTNFKPKMDLALPDSFEAYTRRWQLVQPGDQGFEKVTAGLKRDLEREAYNLLVQFRCAPFLPEYLAALRLAEPKPLDGFHPMHNGMDFRRPYRWGILGDYLKFTPVSMRDRLRHFKNTRLKGRLRKLVG